MIAERLARAGVGHLRLVDRDWVEWSNLQRQCLFTENDARQSLPKAEAASAALRSINSGIEIEPVVEDVNHQTIEQLASGCDLILDGTDNFETRFLVNDYSIRQGVPWVHGGCLGASGQILSIVPTKTACFRCLVPELPPREAMETCDSAGVLGSAIGIIASWQSAEALKLLAGHEPASGLIVIDSWNTDCRIMKLSSNPNCPTCGKGEFPFLDGQIRSATTILCGKNAVQIESPSARGESLEQIASRAAPLGEVFQNAFFVRLKLAEHTVTVFRGGRTVVEGTTNEAEAKSVLAKTIGG